jgi:thiol-disulfide isomerase/thioredoxin
MMDAMAASQETAYRDKRHSFWRDTFAQALPYTEYLDTGPENHRKRWRTMERQVPVSDAQSRRLRQFTRRMNVLCYSGIWCGDCVRQGPILHHLATAANNGAGAQVVDLRFAERVDDSELADELRILGALRVPVTVCLSEDFFELGRTGDRMLVTYRRKAQRELGPACDVGLVPPADAEIATEVEQWLDHLERMQWMLRLSPMLRVRHGD